MRVVVALKVMVMDCCSVGKAGKTVTTGPPHVDASNVVVEWTSVGRLVPGSSVIIIGYSIK